MKNNTTLISVIIPVLDGAKFILEAIESVMQQEHHTIEIIVVDDGSTDNTAELVQSLGSSVKYIYQENGGVAKARNTGLKMAVGDYIAFIDADDIYLKDKLSIQMNYFASNPTADIIMGLLVQVPLDNHTNFQTIDTAGKKGALVSCMGSMLIRKRVFAKIGVFDEEMLQAEDLDWLNRAREQDTKVLVHKEIVQLRRKHDKNITNNTGQKNHYLLKAYKKSLDRRRIPGGKTVQAVLKLEKFDELATYWLSQKS